MAQLTDYWRKVADRCLGKEYDTLRALMAEDRGSKEVNRGRVFLSKVASTDLGEKHVRIEMTMNALARRVVDRKLLEHLDSAWGADHRKEFDLLFTGHPELFKASHRDAPVRFRLAPTIYMSHHVQSLVLPGLQVDAARLRGDCPADLAPAYGQAPGLS